MLHHAFLKAGFSVLQTTLIMTALVLATTAIGLAGQVLAWPEYLVFYGYNVLGLIYNCIMDTCWKKGRFLGFSVVVPGWFKKYRVAVCG